MITLENIQYLQAFIDGEISQLKNSYAEADKREAEAKDNQSFRLWSEDAMQTAGTSNKVWINSSNQTNWIVDTTTAGINVSGAYVDIDLTSSSTWTTPSTMTEITIPGMERYSNEKDPDPETYSSHSLSE